MKTTLSALSLIAALAVAGGVSAQVPSGGPDAKGNAPLKHGHTVNDGTAKPGHTSFTRGQAERHIVHAGYASVTGLTKGRDGVWRGTAMKNGASVQVGLDFKGNVSEGGAPMSSMISTTTTKMEAAPAPMPMASGGDTTPAMSTTSATAGGGMAMHHRHHRHHRRHHGARCAHPGPNGVACSGIDRNRNGISDKEDRAMKAGAKP